LIPWCLHVGPLKIALRALKEMRQAIKDSDKLFSPGFIKTT
jgi:hypothetical protein